MISTTDVLLRAGGRDLIKAFDWRAEAGQCWCIIGRNGAGKSTLLRTLAGLRAPDAGHVKLKATALAQWKLLDLARERAYLPQGRNDAFGYRVIETVMAARHPYQDAHYWDAESDYGATHAALQALDVAHLAERDIRSLSGGERQRVAIAAVLAQETPLLLLDEPANALDLAHQVSVMKLIAQLCRTQKKTVLLVSHDLNLARAAATHALLLMDNGHWHAGTVEEVMQAPLLSHCLGYPIEVVEHAGRVIYIPAKDDHE